MRLLRNGPLAREARRDTANAAGSAENRRAWLLSVACAVSAAACTSAGGAAQQTGQETGRRTATLFEGARVIVGDGTTTIENAAFLVQGNRITSIGRSGEVQAPPGATRVNLTGKTVMPALVDLHSHIGYEDTAANTEDEEVLHARERHRPSRALRLHRARADAQPGQRQPGAVRCAVRR